MITFCPHITTAGGMQSNLTCPDTLYTAYLECNGRTPDTCTGSCAWNTQVCGLFLRDKKGGGWEGCGRGRGAGSCTPDTCTGSCAWNTQVGHVGSGGE
jgi:hypothetical protein